jgi:hypothetical protein
MNGSERTVGEATSRSGLSAAVAWGRRDAEGEDGGVVRIREVRAAARAPLPHTSPRNRPHRSWLRGTGRRSRRRPRPGTRCDSRRRAAYHLVPRIAEPGQQRGVDLGDLPVKERRQVAARRVLVQVLRAVLEQGTEGSRLDLAGVRGGGPGLAFDGIHDRGSAAKAVIAARVASGALSWGRAPRSLR